MMLKKLKLFIGIVIVGGVLSLIIEVPTQQVEASASDELTSEDTTELSIWEYCLELMQNDENSSNGAMLTGGGTIKEDGENADDLKTFIKECYDWVEKQSRTQSRMNCH